MSELTTPIVKGAIGAAINLSKELVSYLARAGKRELGKLSVDLEYGLKKFIERNYRQYSRIKTLINPETPAALESAFESPDVEIGDRILGEDELLEVLESENFVVLTGLGGSGKSVFLKHFFIRFYNEARGRIPFLVELRNLPDGMALVEYMFKQIQAVVPQFDTDMFEYALRGGKFVFLLDGFDEVDFEMRPALSEEIVGLTYSYGENLVLVSSRPDDIFKGWGEFTVVTMRGFTKNQVKSLVRKVRYDKNVKKAFIRLVEQGQLYETHGAYLSNPLLCTIMLLTFDQGAEIPTKMHLFFGQTFDVLFYRHDATKGTAFRRKFLTTLAIDDFRSVFAAFSAFSYLDFGPTIGRQNAVLAATRSLEYCRQDQKPEYFLDDLCSSVSLMIREGDIYSYIHRTFQEYFFALFLATRDISNFGDVVERLVKEKPNDSVVEILSDLNRDRFEQEFLAPRLRLLCKDLAEIDIAVHPSRAFLLFYIEFSVRGDSSSSHISSWTVGREKASPKWYYLTRFLREGPALEKLDGFDWWSLVAPLRGTNVAGNVEVEPVDDLLLRTPMVAYLQALKENASQILTSIESSAASQNRLLSSTLFSRTHGDKAP